MKNMAFVDDQGVVQNISYADDDWSAPGWIEYTSANAAFIGGTYVDGTFIPPQPYPSWSLDDSGTWVPPVPRPAGDGIWLWDEASLSWVTY